MNRDRPAQRPGPGLGVEAVALAACVAVGVLLATLPHLLGWPRLGEPAWIADRDELDLYLATAARAYREHSWTLSDPVVAGPGATIYPRLQMMPGIVAARALGLGPMGISLAWRAWAGLSIAVGWYLLVRHYVRRPWVAAALTVVLLADIGLVTGHLGWRLVRVALEVIAGRAEGLLAAQPRIHTQWRIITPGLSLVFLLVHLGLLARARERPSAGRLAAAGVGFGLLFYAYFYFWTAAGLGLLVAGALDAGRRRAYATVGALGGWIGLPALLAGARLRGMAPPDWLHRSDLFLPIPRGGELLIPWVAGAILALGLARVVAGRRDLIPVWALAASGVALANHSVVTGLQIQNYHWGYVWGPCTSVLLVLLIAGDVAVRDSVGSLERSDPASADRTGAFHAPDHGGEGDAEPLESIPFSPAPAIPNERPRILVPRAVVGVAMVLLGLHLATSIGLRGVEALRTRQSVELLQLYARYRAQRSGPGAPRLVPGAVVAGPDEFVGFAVVLEGLRPLENYAVVLSPAVRDAEWDERIALNAYLGGLDRAAFGVAQRAGLDATLWGPEARDPLRRAARLANRLRAYDTVAADPSAALDRLAVRYLARPAGQPRPRCLAAGWRPIQGGPAWEIWERVGDRVGR